MNHKYGVEYIKALATMISRGDFNKFNLTIDDFETYLNYVDLNEYVSTSSVELNMLTGEYQKTDLIKYYNNESTISTLNTTALDILLYSSINQDLIFKKLLTKESADFTKAAYSLNKLLSNNHFEKAELLISKGIELTSVIPNAKISIVELQLISIISALTLSRNSNKYDNIEKLDFILKYNDSIDVNTFLIIEDILNNSINFVREFYMPSLELKQLDILSRIEEFINIIKTINI